MGRNLDTRPTTPTCAIAYYRVSTAKQGESGLGLAAQRDAVERYAVGAGLRVVAEYREVESGKRSDRPQLAAALADVKARGGVLLIAKLDRLARNVHFISGLMESGAPFVAVDNPTVTPLTLHVLAAVAEQEAKMISARTRAALAVAKANGVELGTPGNLTPEAQQAGAAAHRHAARDAYKRLIGYAVILRDVQHMSYARIAATLNAEGHTTRTGRPFQAMTVKRLMDRAKG